MARPRTRIAMVAVFQIGCASAPDVRFPARTCPRGFDASFIQLGQRELGYGEFKWRHALSVLRSAGVTLVLLQFSGDDDGGYDRPAGRAPVRALLAAAGSMHMTVFLGLYRDSSWPA